MIRAQGRRAATTLFALCIMLAALAVVSLKIGSTPLSWSRVAAAVLGGGDWIDEVTVLDLRMPRIAVAMLAGAGLAVAGVILQGITTNDLASPSTMGVDAGSGLGLVLLMVLYPAASQFPWLAPAAALAGAAATTTLVFALAYRRGAALPSRLLLVGVAISFGAHAVMLVISLRMNFVTYNYVVTWMAGTLAAADWKAVRLLLPCVLVLVPLAMSRARVLDALALGDASAVSLGVAVDAQRLVLLALATALTSVCVALGGHLGFLGLMAPHIARRLVGVNHRVLFPAAALCGAILLVAADSVGRQAFAPVEIPTGVLVGIFGGGYFLYLLATTRG